MSSGVSFVSPGVSKSTERANKSVLMQIGGEWLVAGGESADVTGDEAMFGLGTSQLVFLAGNVLQVSPHDHLSHRTVS